MLTSNHILRYSSTGANPTIPEAQAQAAGEAMRAADLAAVGPQLDRAADSDVSNDWSCLNIDQLRELADLLAIPDAGQITEKEAIIAEIERRL